MTQSKGYVDPQYLAAVAERLKEAKERSYSLMHVQTGQRVLDVGCGPGTDTLPLAHLVAWLVDLSRHRACANSQRQDAGPQELVFHEQLTLSTLR